MSSQLVTAATLSKDSAVLQLEADVVVIGSGAGGDSSRNAGAFCRRSHASIFANCAAMCRALRG